MKETLKDLINSKGIPDASYGRSKGMLTFGELFGLKAETALGIPKCTYIELLDGWESKKKSNIVFSLQKSTLEQLSAMLPEEPATERALFLVNTNQSSYNNRVYVQLNTKIIDALSMYRKQYPDKHNAITALYDALYVGDWYSMNYYQETDNKPFWIKSVKGLRDMFYIDTRPVEWFPIVKEPTEVERPDGSGETDLYSPDKTDVQVKQSKTKTLAMLAIAAFSLLN